MQVLAQLHTWEGDSAALLVGMQAEVLCCCQHLQEQSPYRLLYSEAPLQAFLLITSAVHWNSRACHMRQGRQTTSVTRNYIKRGTGDKWLACRACVTALAVGGISEA